jgi:hypothetical protein
VSHIDQLGNARAPLVDAHTSVAGSGENGRVCLLEDTPPLEILFIVAAICKAAASLEPLREIADTPHEIKNRLKSRSARAAQGRF